MSHITTVDGMIIIPKNHLIHLLDAVKEFCPQLELMQGQTHYRTWKDDHHGKLVGDWSLPEGWTEKTVGEGAHHVIRMTDKALGAKNRNASGSPYEIGVVPVDVERDVEGNVLNVAPNPDGEEYVLMTDWYNNGNGILKCEGVGVRHMGMNPQTRKKTEISFGDLYMHYRMKQTQSESEMQGDTVSFQKQEDGTYTAEVETVARTGQ